MTMAQFGPQAMNMIGVNLAEFFRRMFDSYHFPEPWALVSEQADEMQEQMRQAQIAQQNPFLQAQAQAHGAIAQSREENDHQTLQKLLDLGLQMHQPQAGNGNGQRG